MGIEHQGTKNCGVAAIKILHVNNLANVSVELREAQKRQGHEAIVIQTNKNYLNYNEDWRLYSEPGFFHQLGFRMTFLAMIRWADVIHVHGGLWKRFGRFIHFLRKPLVIHYHGSDVRGVPYLHGSRAGEKYADSILLSTPDLRQYCRGFYVPNPITPNGKGPKIHDGFQVIHAHAGRKGAELVKGSETIKKIVSSISGVQYREIVGLSHAEALEEYRSADLAIDQMRIGWYGVFALECMAMGIPTLGYVKPFGEPNPLIPVTMDNLKATVQRLAADPEELRRTAVRQAMFVRKVHDPDKIARQIELHYERIGGR